VIRSAYSSECAPNDGCKTPVVEQAASSPSRPRLSLAGTGDHWLVPLSGRFWSRDGSRCEIADHRRGCFPIKSSSITHLSYFTADRSSRLPRPDGWSPDAVWFHGVGRDQTTTASVQRLDSPRAFQALSKRHPAARPGRALLTAGRATRLCPYGPCVPFHRLRVGPTGSRAIWDEA